MSNTSLGNKPIATDDSDYEARRHSLSSANRSDLLEDEAFEADGSRKTNRCSPPKINLDELDTQKPAVSAFSQYLASISLSQC